MNVKKAIKRIVALAAGTTMVTATIMGAMAYDLGDYPEPFVKNGVFDGKIVVGKTAQVSDVIGAIDVAASLQAAAKTAVDVDGNVATVTVSGGAQVMTGSQDLNFGDALTIKDSGVFDDDDFPELLADGIVEDDDGTEYDYEQTVSVPALTVTYGQNDDYSDDPVFYMDVDSGEIITYTVTLKDTVNATDLDDSETIEMFGKVFTFDPDNSNGEDFTLFGSDVTVTATQNEPVTVEVDGEEYTIEILGGNSDDSTAIIRVTGDSTVTKTLEAGDSRTMAGLDVYIDDVFISNIGEDTISVGIFVGSEKIVIPDADTSWTELEINGEDDTDIYGKLTGTVGALTKMEFKVEPTDFKDPALDDDEWDWITMGTSFEDPLFGFSLAFDSMTPSVEGRDAVEFARSGDTVSIAFTNNEGDDYEVDLYTATGTNLDFADDFYMTLNADGNMSLADGKYFVIEETESDVGESVTHILEVRDIEFDGADSYVSLKNLATGQTFDVDEGDEVEDTGAYVDVTSASEFLLRTTSGGAINYTADTRIIADGGLAIALDSTVTGADEADIVVTEDADDLDEQAPNKITFTIEDDADDDIIISTIAMNGSSVTAADEDDEVGYGISEYGTYATWDKEDKGWLNVYYSETEVDYNVFLNGPDAVVVTSGSADAGVAYNVNEFVVGQIAVYDDEAMSLIGSTPLIAVGGPCVNTVSADLMGNPEVCYEGFTDGKAKIKLFESQNALMVAGSTGEDTTGAAQVLAAYDMYDLSGDEVEVITTDLTDLEVNVVE